jgi:hypothetical protein
LPEAEEEGNMTIDERARHALHSRLAAVLGEDEATTLMTHLPPVGWADLATVRDLDHLADRLRADLYERLGSLHQGLNARMEQQTRVLLFSILASHATFAAIVLGAIRLL